MLPNGRVSARGRRPTEKEIMRGLLVFAFIFYASAAAFGQAGGTITGHVTDSQGRVVHQANVQLVELKRSTATDRSQCGSQLPVTVAGRKLVDLAVGSR